MADIETVEGRDDVLSKYLDYFYPPARSVDDPEHVCKSVCDYGCPKYLKSLAPRKLTEVIWRIHQKRINPQLEANDYDESVLSERDRRIYSDPRYGSSRPDDLKKFKKKNRFMADRIIKEVLPGLLISKSFWEGIKKYACSPLSHDYAVDPDKIMGMDFDYIRLDILGQMTPERRKAWKRKRKLFANITKLEENQFAIPEFDNDYGDSEPDCIGWLNIYGRYELIAKWTTILLREQAELFKALALCISHLIGQITEETTRSAMALRKRLFGASAGGVPYSSEEHAFSMFIAHLVTIYAPAFADFLKISKAGLKMNRDRYGLATI